MTVWGTGTPRREFLYSEDMADACVHLMNLPGEKFSLFLTPHASPVVNIGCGEDITIRELAETVKRVVGFQGELKFDSSKPDGTLRKLLSVERLSSLGWKMEIGLGVGLKLAYADFLNTNGGPVFFTSKLSGNGQER